MRRVVVLFVLVAAVLTAACGPSESSTGNEDGGDATEKAGTAGVGPSPRAPGYFFIGNDMGMPRPCGCSKPALGGIVRRMGFFESLPEGVSKGSLLVSGGNLIHEGGRQQELKLETFLQELDALGAAAHCLGADDLQVGSFFWEDTLAARGEDGTPLVSVNVTKEGHRLFRSHVVAATPEGEAVVTGWIDPTSAGWTEPGLVAEESPDVADVVGALQEKRRDLVLFAAASAERAREFLERSGLGKAARHVLLVIPGISDIPWLHPSPPPPLLELGLKGQRVAYIGSLKAPVLERFVLLDADRGSETGRSLLEFYRENLAAEDLLAQIPRFESAPAAYIGSKACGACHASALKVWERSGHAHAWEALEAKGDEVDPECVRCHVTGFGLIGGFDPASSAPVNVQCEACHGPGAEHAASRAPTPGGTLGGDFCLQCHDVANSPHFKFEDYWPRIAHALDDK